MAGPKAILSKGVFIVNKINCIHLLRSMFEVLCMQKLAKPYSLILFTKTRWSTCYFMVKRLLQVKTALVAMPHSVDHEPAFEDVSMDSDLREAILDISYWKGTGAMELLLKPLCSAITYSEGDEATFSSVYACFLSVAHHVLTMDNTILQVIDHAR